MKRTHLCECCGAPGATATAGGRHVCRPCLAYVLQTADSNPGLSLPDCVQLTRERNHPDWASTMAWLQGGKQ